MENVANGLPAHDRRVVEVDAVRLRAVNQVLGNASKEPDTFTEETARAVEVPRAP
ncbi:hypothetical protein [Streptomyces sp. NPDC019224]|uniref:hypothetical protein n=1 Tax=Streptomyces sp. NPDC019224 TaxID=3154484 RepID=UPI0033EB4F7D